MAPADAPMIGHAVPCPLTLGVSAPPAPADLRDWHRNLYGNRWTRRWGIGWGRLHGVLARRLDFSADRHLVQIEVFGRYVNICR